MRSYAANEEVKTTVKQIQESMGDMLVIENRIITLILKLYSIARNTLSTDCFESCLICLNQPH